LEEIMEDKRTYERFDLEVSGNIGLLNQDQTKMDMVSIKTINICAGGGFFKTEASIPSGTRVKLELKLAIDKLKEMLDSHCRILVEGEVIRTGENGIAIKFDDNYELIPVTSEMN